MANVLYNINYDESIDADDSMRFLRAVHTHLILLNTLKEVGALIND